MAALYRANPEKYKARVKKAQAENREQYRASRRALYHKRKECSSPEEWARYRERRASATKKWQGKNKEYISTYAKQRLESRMEVFIRIKREQGCKVCGLNDHRCLDFHHRDPTEKSFTLSQARHKTMDAIEAEIAKCDVVCANCHRIAHWTARRGA